MIPHGAAAAIKKQEDADNLQLLQQQPILTAEQALWNQERRILLKELSGQGIIDGPIGGMFPGDGLPALQVLRSVGCKYPLSVACKYLRSVGYRYPHSVACKYRRSAGYKYHRSVDTGAVVW